ncbi:COG1361 S-layer family protein [Methanococcoides burtonii]|uniref:Uncharacterized protein n=1 Tax=Methanococcoides burtonii (strain DSM 6242 / NBRC 107633 / OCM 468 / ACE-M) TaxID=259564 RepID=Q12Y11_METBU|nr:COG1361 S-layer family protein [Methanococcoides burtonii]ABE51665.1 Hypothetical protein Mbur_0700 [Methanococcoides burtonii DSM 6242]
MGNYSSEITKEITVFAVMIVLLIMVMPTVSAQENSVTSLDISIQKYEPFPAEIGQYVDVWVKVENFRSGQSDDVTIKIVPEYPLSLDSEKNAENNIGILSPDSASVQEFRLYVDENAKPGTASFDVYYRGTDNSPWIKDTFKIKVGSTTFDSKGTLELTETTSTPNMFSPGDKGTISFKLTNTASENTINIDGEDYDTNARIQSASLTGADSIKVTSGVQEAGIVGPGNSVTLTFNVEVPEDVQEGTYYLDLAIIGNSYSYNTIWRVPVTIDSSSLKMIPSKSMILTNSEGKIQFDIANLHQNTISSVSVRPIAEGIKFSPAEYFIGSMKPDELFTIEFSAVAEEEIELTPLTLEAEYRNGFNDHTTSADVGELEIVEEKTDTKAGSSTIAFVLLIVAAAGIFIYKKRKQD